MEKTLNPDKSILGAGCQYFCRVSFSVGLDCSQSGGPLAEGDDVVCTNTRRQNSLRLLINIT